MRYNSILTVRKAAKGREGGEDGALSESRDWNGIVIYRKSHRIAVDRSKFLGLEGPSWWNLGGSQEIAVIHGLDLSIWWRSRRNQPFESESKIEDPTQPDLAVA